MSTADFNFLRSTFKKNQTYRIGTNYRNLLPPHGGSDPGATYNGRQEKDDVLRLTMSVGALLQNAGFDVEYTRTTDVYDTPFEKATIANDAEGDLLISFHRNSSPVSNMYNGVQTLVYNDQGIKAELARNINENLVAIGFEDKGVIERPNLVVLKRSKMPAVLVEVGFINSDEDNQIFDDSFEEIAQAIADGIIDTVNDQAVTTAMEYDSQAETENWEDNNPPNPINLNNNREKLGYSIQTGAFRNRHLAANMVLKLKRQGFPAEITAEDDLYKVRVGKYKKLDNGIAVEQKLRKLGYNTFIVVL